MLKMVRDGKKAPPTCPECDCRLNVFTWGDETYQFAHHFTGEVPERDARGHTCSLIGKVWTMESRS